ncbi:hypothetical protein FRC18_010369 [Serendipita sp. 400]|nr:hypothetical protein FRC18_010369 [Serendipita sp. 400]
MSHPPPPAFMPTSINDDRVYTTTEIPYSEIIQFVSSPLPVSAYINPLLFLLLSPQKIHLPSLEQSSYSHVLSSPMTSLRIISASDTSKSLDLNGNIPQEGQKIQIWPQNSTTAQVWVVNPHEGGSYSIQSGNDGDLGYGFFQAAKQDQGEPVVYTRLAWLWNIKHVSDNEYRLETEDGQFALTVTSDEDDTVSIPPMSHIPSTSLLVLKLSPKVMIDNVQENLDRQRWKFDPPLPGN